MEKLAYVLAAIGAIALALPSMATTASAQTVVIKRDGGHHHGYKHRHGARAQMHQDRGYHRRHVHRDRVIVIKKRHHHHH